jgi:hypothetical protein
LKLPEVVKRVLEILLQLIQHSQSCPPLYKGVLQLNVHAIQVT